MADPKKDKIIKASNAMLKQMKATMTVATTVSCQAKKGKPVIDTVLTCQAGMKKLKQEYLKLDSAITKLNSLVKSGKSPAEKLAKQLIEIADKRSRIIFDVNLEQEALLATHIAKLKKIKH